MRKFWFHCLMVTIITFALMGGLYKVLQLNLFSAFDPIGQAIGDMQLSDIAFSMREEPLEDPYVAMVNVGELSRSEIGDEIRNVIKYKPKVIGFDALFSTPSGDTLGNLLLSSAIAEASEAGVKVVMAETLHQSKKLSLQDTEEQDSIEHALDDILQNSYEGFVNLDTDAKTQEDLKACRAFAPKARVQGKQELAFSVRLAMLYDSIKTQQFLDRNKAKEIINYRGNVVDMHGASLYSNQYPLLDPIDALDTAYNKVYDSLLSGKILIFGFLGKDMTDTAWDDKFFTPLNKNYAGKTRPDMYGPVVHANAVSMILKEDYVNEMALWQQIGLAAVVLILTAALFFKIEEKMPIWYDLLSLGIQVVLFLIFSVTMILVFSYLSVKLDFTLTLAAVALVGTCFELYNGGALRLYLVITSRLSKKTKEV